MRNMLSNLQVLLNFVHANTRITIQNGLDKKNLAKTFTSIVDMCQNMDNTHTHRCVYKTGTVKVSGNTKQYS